MDISTKLTILAADIAKGESSLAQSLEVISELLRSDAKFERNLANRMDAGITRDIVESRTSDLFILAAQVDAANAKFAEMANPDIAWTF